MLAHRCVGAGPPLLLIHGWGVSYAIWEQLEARLKDRFTLIEVKLPGIDESPQVDPGLPYYSACADEIEALRQPLGVEHWAVLAYSVGTRAAEAYVQRYPRSVSRVVFLCPARLTAFSALGLRVARWLNDRRPEYVDRVISGRPLDGLIRWLGFNGRAHKYAGVWARAIKSQRVESLKRQLYELPESGRARFEAPAVPALFIWGRNDNIMVRLGHGRRAGERHVKLGSIPARHVSIRAGHSAPMLAADDIVRVALPFLAGDEVVGNEAPAERGKASQAPDGVNVWTQRSGGTQA